MVGEETVIDAVRGPWRWLAPRTIVRIQRADTSPTTSGAHTGVARWLEGAGARDRGAPRPPSVTASDLAGSVRYAVGAAGAVALVLGVLQTQGAHALREW